MKRAASFLPLLARCVFVLGLVVPAALRIVVYPARVAEARAYAQAPRCEAGAAPSPSCRAVVEVQVRGSSCQSGWGSDFCEVELDVNGEKRFIGLHEDATARLKKGSLARIEVFQKLPAAIEIDGAMVREAGAPEEAAATLRTAMMGSVIAAAIAGLVLVWLRMRGVPAHQ